MHYFVFFVPTCSQTGQYAFLLVDITVLNLSWLFYWLRLAWPWPSRQRGVERLIIPWNMRFSPHLKLYILLNYICVSYIIIYKFYKYIYISSETPVLGWGYFSPSWFPWRPPWSWRAQGLPVAAHPWKPWSSRAARVQPVCTSTQGIPVNLQPSFSFPFYEKWNSFHSR